MGWDVRQEIAQAEPGKAAQSILDNLNGGSSSITLVLDRAARTLDDGYGQSGVAIANLSELATALEHLDLEKVPVELRAGASSVALAAGLVALARQRGTRGTALSGSLGLDPLGLLAESGRLTGSLDSAYDQAAQLASWASKEASALRTLNVDTAPYHEAGADAASEIARRPGHGRGVPASAHQPRPRHRRRRSASCSSASASVATSSSRWPSCALHAAPGRRWRRQRAAKPESAGHADPRQHLAAHQDPARPVGEPAARHGRELLGGRGRCRRHHQPQLRRATRRAPTSSASAWRATRSTCCATSPTCTAWSTPPAAAGTSSR